MSLNLKSLVNGLRAIVITDDKVHSLYGHLFEGLDVVVIPQGDINKNLDTAKYVYQRLLELEADRTCFLIGFGGGVVLDMTGFTASTFIRGLKFGFVPTTLLAQADAAYGGKNGVNFEGTKNIVGLIAKPEFIYSDSPFLKTLDDKELKCGLVEIIKMALVADQELFRYLEIEKQKILNLDKEIIEEVIKRGVKIKMDMVSVDEFDNGERRKLNFGHTLGHALEDLSDGLLSHGEAVSEGIMFAIKVSVSLGHLKAEEAERIEQAFWSYGIKTGSEIKKYRTQEIMNSVVKDKKRADNAINFVFLEAVGQAFILSTPITKLEELINDLR